MAHVGEDRRGQIMIVMSLVLAVMLVAMALYLNTAIFTENLATRKGDIAGAGGAVSYKVAAVEGASGSMAFANYHNNSSYAELDERFQADMANWSEMTNRLESTRARSANVSVEGTTNGTRIYQDHDRTFTNVSDSDDWPVVTDVDDVRKFRMNVTRENLTESSPGNSPQDEVFVVTFDDGTIERNVEVYKNTTEGEDDIFVSVRDEADTEIGSCSVPVERGVVDVTGGELAGEPCEPLLAVADLDDGFDVYYNQTVDGGEETVLGTYELIVDEEDVDPVGIHYGMSPGDDAPYLTDALYSAEIRVTYETARISYETVVRVAPGEPE